MSDHPYLAHSSEDQIVYVRPVNPADLPRNMRQQTKNMASIWSIHDADGHVLALVDDRDKAFRVARQNERQPVSVH